MLLSTLQLDADVDCWEYAGEGGKHTIFSYSRPARVPSDYVSPRPTTWTAALENGDSGKNIRDVCPFEGTVLRIEKKHLAMSEFVTERIRVRNDISGGEQNKNQGSSRKSTLYHDTVYVQSYVAPSMESYVNSGESVPLSWSFLRKMRAKTIEMERVPVARKKDWFWAGKSRSRLPEVTEIPYGVILPDYRLPMAKQAPRTSAQYTQFPSTTIAIELKPKAGYLAFSPLVDPMHRVKYMESRFVTLQHLYKEGLITKGWISGGRSPFTITTYDPLDLFSGDTDRIRKSIRSLLSNCQNNMRVWLDGTQMLGLGADANSSTTEHAMLNSKSAKGFKWKDMVLESLSEILSKESILQKMLAIQKLDILDADGASLVFQSMVKHCGGSFVDAERDIDGCKESSMNRHKASIHPLFRHSPFSLPLQHGGLISLCEEIENFSRVLDSSQSVSKNALSGAKLDQLRHQAIKCVAELSYHECQYLLKNWLLSSALCDASIFCTCEVAPSSALASPPIALEGTSMSKIFIGEDDAEHIVRYQLRLTDCGSKPARKLRCLEEREFPFRLRKISAQDKEGI